MSVSSIRPAIIGVYSYSLPLSEDWMQAAQEGDVKRIQELLFVQKGPLRKDPKDLLDCTREDESTALMIAASMGHIDVVEVLIQAGASVNLQDDEGRTALMCAALNGGTEIVEALIQAGASVNLEDDEGQTASMYAEMRGRNGNETFLVLEKASKEEAKRKEEAKLEFLLAFESD